MSDGQQIVTGYFMTETRIYKIQIQGHLHKSWSGWFDGMEVEHEVAEGGILTTTLTGPLADQTALYGLLARMRDLSLDLIALKQSEARLENDL
jgi:hypothetical protein